MSTHNIYIKPLVLWEDFRRTFDEYGDLLDQRNRVASDQKRVRRRLDLLRRFFEMEGQPQPDKGVNVASKI